MEDVALLLRGAIQAQARVLLKLNVSAPELAAVTEILPAMSSPTITWLARTDMHAVEAVVPKRGVNTLIPALKAAGARLNSQSADRVMPGHPTEGRSSQTHS